jgi:ABC-type transport system involved in multi-copper enzyme maturation permease subunit
MKGIRAAWVVFAFEWRRTMGWARLPFMVALAAFPAAILWLIRHEGGRLDQQAEPLAIALFVLVPEIVCLLGLLLWATPVIHSEVENKTWPYLAVRPAGKGPILLGKYAASVLWTMLTGWLALAVCLLVLLPGQPAVHAWGVIAALVPLSCLAYGALFVLLGVIFLRRGMMIAVAYTLFEFVLRWIPATVKELTVQYHLQSLLVRWMHWDHTRLEIHGLLGTGPAWHHVLGLVAYAAILLGIAAVILRWRELVVATET